MYPDTYGEGTGSKLDAAMDIARGGKFTSIPNPYPSGAWYTYDDETCTYNCQAGEYIYWATNTALGSLENVKDMLNEWNV